MKKTILISSLLLSSAISILPYNSIFSSELKMNKGEKILVSNTSNLNDSDEANVFNDKNYTSIFFNNLTSPIISPNIEVPGFLGAWDTDSIDVFPNAIGWTTPDLFQSWSVYLKDHPSLKATKDVPSNFVPGLVTAIYSDNNYSLVKRNQIFAIVANTANLAAKEYWILRYNAIDGSPIEDNNAKMPPMPNSPLPQKTINNGNGSAIALANDTANNRYLAFYPGRLGDLKNDIFGFEITNDNKIDYLYNRSSFFGSWNWSSSISPTASIDYFDDNFVLGLSPFDINTISSNGASMSLILATPSSSNILNFRILNLKSNFEAINGFTTKPLTGSIGGIFNNVQSVIEVPKNLLNLEAVQKSINPHLQLFNFTTDTGQNTHKAQMIVPILKDDEWVYMYLSGIFDPINNTYYDKWGTNGNLSQGSFFTSPTSNDMPPIISYNKSIPNEIIITSQTLLIDSTTFSANQFIFDSMPNNGLWDPKWLLLLHEQVNNANSNWKSQNIIVKFPNNQDILTWSLPSGQIIQYAIIDNRRIAIQLRDTGGIRHDNFQSTAYSLKWLPTLAEDGRTVNEISNQELETIGPSDNNFFKIPSLNYPLNVISNLSLEIDGEPTRDESDGSIRGIFNLKNEISVSNPFKNFTFFSKIPFKITGLRTEAMTPTSINQNISILNTLPSDLKPNNISNFIDITSVPRGQGEVTIDNWKITNQNNIDGTASVSVNIFPYYDTDGQLVNDPNKPKIFNTNVTGLKKVSGTTITQTSSDISNLTVWDVDDTNVQNFIEINELVPSASISDIEYLIKDKKPLNGELTIIVSIAAGSYYDSNNKGLPSIIGDPPLEASIKITNLKAIPNTGTLVTPKKVPYGVSSSTINEDNIINYFIIENDVPGSIYDLEITGRNNIDDELPSTGGWVSFSIIFDKEYDTNGNIIIGSKKDIIIYGFDLLPPQNNLIPIIGGIIGGSIALILLIIILILLIRYIKEKKRLKGRFSNSPPETSEIVLPVNKYPPRSNNSIYNNESKDKSSPIISKLS